MNNRLPRASFTFVLASLGFVPASAVLVSACAVPITQQLPQGQCASASDCGSGEDCKTWVCEQHQCIEQNAPAGTVPANPTSTAPPCHRLVCDGHGGESVEADPSGTPPQDNVAPCQRAACDASGNVVMMPDPTHLPQDMPGDCRKPACDANGMPSSTPDLTDIPSDTAGDCKSPSCDASGNPTTVPANDPPKPGPCTAYTCNNGTAVASPANVGMKCSPEGFVCGADSSCNTCPMADATCTDPGPGANAHTLTTAHDFGTIGWCDEDGFGVCGSLQMGVTSYFGYKADGGITFCDFSPYVAIAASAPVTLCEYFECPSVTCPASSKAATLNGVPGCCATGAASSMAIVPSCQDSQVYITVSSQNPTCTSYSMNFHS